MPETTRTDRVLVLLRNLLKQAEMSFLEIGSILYEVRESASWRQGFESYEAFLNEARISKSVASVLVKVYKHFVLDGGKSNEQLAVLGYSNLYSAIPLLEAGEDIDTVLAKVKLLTRDELKQEIRDEKHSDCPHLERITICSVCKVRIYDDHSHETKQS